MPPRPAAPKPHPFSPRMSSPTRMYSAASRERQAAASKPPRSPSSSRSPALCSTRSRACMARVSHARPISCCVGGPSQCCPGMGAPALNRLEVAAPLAARRSCCVRARQCRRRQRSRTAHAILQRWRVMQGRRGATGRAREYARPSRLTSSVPQAPDARVRVSACLAWREVAVKPHNCSQPKNTTMVSGQHTHHDARRACANLHGSMRLRGEQMYSKRTARHAAPGQPRLRLPGLRQVLFGGYRLHCRHAPAGKPTPAGCRAALPWPLPGLS